MRFFIKFSILLSRNGKLTSITPVEDDIKTPFGEGEVSTGQLTNLRNLMRVHPQVRRKVKLLERVDRADSKGLCELYLQLEQTQMKKTQGSSGPR